MRLIVEEYLKELKERDELEGVVAGLMSAMGLVVLTEPTRGGRQHGVDLAVVGRMPDGEVEKLYLFSIKRGNIDRSNWDSGTKQDLRPSINEITSVYVKTGIPPEHKGKPIVVCICCGGKVDEKVWPDIQVYLNDEKERLDAKGIEFEQWNGCKLSDLICKYFCSESVLVDADQRLLKRSLSMVDEPEVSIRNFMALVRAIMKAGEDDKTRGRTFSVKQLNLCLGLLGHFCEGAKNLEAVLQSLEMCLPLLWNYLGLKDITGRSGKEMIRAFLTTWGLYVRYESAFLEKVSPLSKRSFFFTCACGANDEVDVNLQIFRTMGRVSSFGLGMYYMERWLIQNAEGVDDLQKAYGEIREKCAKTLMGLVNGNPTAHGPLLDGQSIDISATMLLLVYCGYAEFIKDYIHAILRRVATNLVIGRGFPVLELTYARMLDHVHEAHNSEYKKEVLPSSELIPQLALIAGVLKDEDCYEAVCGVWKNHLPHANLQMWFPGKETEASFFSGQQNFGNQLVSIDITDKTAFLKSVKDESQQGMLPSTSFGAMAGLTFVCCVTRRIPIPPQYWLAIADAMK